MRKRRRSRVRRRPQTGGKGGAEPLATIRHRERAAVGLSADGYSQYDIAERLGISQPAVSKMLRRVGDRWLAENQKAVGRQKATLVRQNEAVFNRAMIAFDQSKGERVRKSQRKIRGAKGSETVVTDITAETSPGDPRHLEVARKTIADRLRAFDTKAEAAMDLPMEFTLKLDKPVPPAPPDALPDGPTDSDDEEDA